MQACSFTAQYCHILFSQCHCCCRSGDPTVFGNLPPHPAVKEAVKKVLEEGKYNGYGHSSGLEVTRRAVAEEHSIPDAPLTADVSETPS